MKIPKRFVYFAPLLIFLIGAAQPLRASQSSTTWSELFSPDKITRSFLEYGLSAARSILDLKYDEMLIDLRQETVEVSNLELMPIFDWDDNFSCKISIPRLSLFSTPSDASSLSQDASSFNLTLTVFDLSAPLSCLPMQLRMAFMSTGRENINFSTIKFSLNYDFPSSGLNFAAVARMPDIAGIELYTNLSYVSFDSGVLSGDQTPVLYLESASATFENFGLWKTLSKIIPTKYMVSETGPEVLADDLRGALATEIKLGVLEKTTDSLIPAWRQFLDEPEIITLHSSIPENKSVFVNINSDLNGFYEAFSPVFSHSKVTKETTVLTSVINQVLDEDPSISVKQKVDVGLALIRGTGIPRNIQLGWKILKNLPPKDLMPHAAEVSKALVPLDPVLAYQTALIAGKENQPGAMGLLSQLEVQLGVSQALDLQEPLADPRIRQKTNTLSQQEMRQIARQLFQGMGQKRSYLNSLYFANICGAQGDIECREIATRIMTKILADSDWATETKIREVEDAALSDWMRQ